VSSGHTFRDATIETLRKRPVLLLLFLLVASGASAQLVESIEVRVTNVDVVVTDRAGKPVRGLTKEDFELFENGKLQPISNFYEIADTGAAASTNTATGAPAELAAPPEELRRRRIAVFVDQESVDQGRRKRAFESIARSLESLIREGDEVTIITHQQSRRVILGLTSDPEAIRKGLADAAVQVGGRTTRQAAREHVIRNAQDMLAMTRERRALLRIEDAYTSSYATATAYADQLYEANKRVINSVKQTLSSMAGLEGKKILIFIGGELQARPGIDVFDAVDAIYRPTGVAVVNSAQTGEAAKRSLQAELRSIAREANANGVTLYAIEASDSGMSRTSAETKNPITDTNSPIDAGAEIETAVTMHGLAAATGGTALVGSSNFDLALSNVARDLSAYYSLGYKPAGQSGDRNITVKVKRPGLNVRSRRGYTLESVDEQMNDRVIANALHPRVGGDFAVNVEVGKPQAEGDAFRIPVTVKFPGDLTTIPDGTGSMAGEFAVYLATAATDGGAVSAVAKDVRPFKFPQQHAKAIQSQPITYTVSLRVRTGEQIMSVAVVDRVGGRSGFARAKFAIP
jgi:VWFA-related protein